MVPAVVLTQSKPVSITAVRPVSAAVPKIMLTQPRLTHPIVTNSKSPIRRHITRSPSPKTSNSPLRVTAARAPVGTCPIYLTLRSLIVDMLPLEVTSWCVALPNLPMTRPRHAYRVVPKSNSPIRRHLPRSLSLKHINSPTGVTATKAPVVSAAQELNGGYVAFGGNPKGGKITGKGKIKTGKLDFDDVYFVKELKFNLFSVSQMCDKKNSVLFTDTKCLVLSPDFKLPDKSQVLLRVPRKNNMYNVNLKNIVPSGDLTCLFAKAI
nr:putative ribonuclease H-like domain-containing protein [Tanacetum cinerariifolium]